MNNIPRNYKRMRYNDKEYSDEVNSILEKKCDQTLTKRLSLL